MSSSESVSYWKERWEQGRTRFHVPEAHLFLVENLEKLGKGKNGERILMPFCGKSLDLLYLYKQDFTVIGVEISPIAINAFFQENNLTHNVKEVNGFKVHMHDERLQIFEGDFFELTPEIIGGTCTRHWDRGGLVAVEPCSQQKYVDTVKKLLRFNGKSLLESFEYSVEYTGPPRCIPLERLETLFGDDFSIKELARVPNEDMPECMNRLPEFTHVLYIIYI